MGAINDLKAKVEDIALAQDMLSRQVASITEQLEQRRKPKERICIYFEEREGFIRAIHYLQDQNVHIDVVGCGAFLAPVSTSDILKAKDFKFGTAKNSKEFYENNKELAEKWREQVRQYYGLS